MSQYSMTNYKFFDGHLPQFEPKCLASWVGCFKATQSHESSRADSRRPLAAAILH